MTDDNVVFLTNGPPPALVPWLEGIAKDGGAAFIERAERTDLDALPTDFLVVIRNTLCDIAAAKGPEAKALRGRARKQAEVFWHAVNARYQHKRLGVCHCFGDASRCVAEPVRYLKQNGYEARQYCRLVDRMVGGAFPLARLPAGSRVVTYGKAEQRCRACGVIGPTEVHHLAPRARFADADDWPTVALCVPCHLRWHREADRVQDWRQNLRRHAPWAEDRCEVCSSTEGLQVMQWLWYARGQTHTSILCAAHAARYCDTMRGYHHTAPADAVQR
jgi:hypothetical protein